VLSLNCKFYMGREPVSANDSTQRGDQFLNLLFGVVGEYCHAQAPSRRGAGVIRHVGDADVVFKQLRFHDCEVQSGTGSQA
jgi:hypothetical protein